MKAVLILFLGLFIGTKAHGETDITKIWGGSGRPGAAYHIGVFKIAGGYSIGELYDVKPIAQLQGYERGEGGWGEIDIGVVAQVHFGYARSADKAAVANFNGTMREARVHYDKLQYGLKLVLPIAYVSPYIGGGFMNGRMTVTDLSGVSDKEHSMYWGRYYHGGLEILFSPFVGLRLEYQNDTIKTRKFQIFGNTAVNVEQHIGKAGLMLYF
jgi:hypothetical protein